MSNYIWSFVLSGHCRREAGGLTHADAFNHFQVEETSNLAPGRKVGQGDRVVRGHGFIFDRNERPAGKCRHVPTPVQHFASPKDGTGSVKGTSVM